MIRIERKWPLVKLQHLFLADRYEGVKEPGQIVVYAYSKTAGPTLQKSTTYQISLADSEDVMLGRMTKMNRYMLRRAEKEPFVVKVMDNPNDQDLVLFQQFYNEFVKTKEIPPINGFRLRTLKLLRDQGVVVLTKLMNRNGVALCYRLYVIDGPLVLNLYTSTGVWLLAQRPELKQQIRFANRYLLWANMQLFKERGLSVYDYGGTTTIQEINQFKEDFGFDEIATYHGLEATSLIGKCIVQVNHWKNDLLIRLRLRHY